MMSCKLFKLALCLTFSSPSHRAILSGAASRSFLHSHERRAGPLSISAENPIGFLIRLCVPLCFYRCHSIIFYPSASLFVSCVCLLPFLFVSLKVCPIPNTAKGHRARRFFSCSPLGKRWRRRSPSRARKPGAQAEIILCEQRRESSAFNSHIAHRARLAVLCFCVSVCVLCVCVCTLCVYSVCVCVCVRECVWPVSLCLSPCLLLSLSLSLSRSLRLSLPPSLSFALSLSISLFFVVPEEVTANAWHQGLGEGDRRCVRWQP